MTALQGKTLYFDCFAGIAGDMIVGALVDAGVPEIVVREALSGVELGGVEIQFDRVKRGALVGTKFRVKIHHDHVHDPVHEHRHYSEIRTLIQRARLSDSVKARALDFFARIARVEAKLHGVSEEEVAFHEIGAIDSIVDFVATAAALDWLRPTHVVARRVPLGSGSVSTAHGMLPVPAPATLELLRNVPVEAGGIENELTTPTGAAILAATACAYGPLPPLAVATVGWGAGDRELPDRPNLLRVVIGDAGAVSVDEEQLLVMEANLDDLSPELVAPLVAELLDAGARDAWLTPVVMKKGRPGFVLSALARPEQRTVVESLLFRESSTIGIRTFPVSRVALERRQVSVETIYGPLDLKVAFRPGVPDETLNVAPEFESCHRTATALKVPLKRVYAEAIASYFRTRG